MAWPRPSAVFCRTYDDRHQVGDLPHDREEVVLAALLEHGLELEGGVEVVFDRVLAAPGDDDDPLDPRGLRLLDDVLDEGTVDERQHLLRLGLGGGKEPRAEPGRRKYRYPHGLHRGEIVP